MIGVITAQPALSGGEIAALIGGVCVIIAAVLTPVYMWLLNRRLGKPNGGGTLMDMTAVALMKIGTTSGMVEALGNKVEENSLRVNAHIRDDRAQFAYITEKVDAIHNEVRTEPGHTSGGLADAVEGRRIEHDIDKADRTTDEQTQVDHLHGQGKTP